MQNDLYYFSGRGNSLSIARALAERTGAGLKPIVAGMEEICLTGGTAGFVIPVIDFGLPAFVGRFIGKLRKDGAPPYLYAVITCGGMPCASMLQLEKLLKKNGLKLSAGWTVKFGLERMENDQWNALMDDIAAAVNAKTSPELPAVELKDRLLTGLLNPMARLMIPGEDKKFRVGADCDGCGICTKICPVKNIVMEDDKPQWRHRCEQCAACFSWCPKAAISGSCLAAKTHYTNPGIKLEQMLLK